MASDSTLGRTSVSVKRHGRASPAAPAAGRPGHRPPRPPVGTVQPLRQNQFPVAYDEGLANRIRELVAGEPDLSEMRMFGGLAFLIGGNMAVSASGQGGLLVRVDPERTDELLAEPHAESFVMRGRPMDGWLRVAPEGVSARAGLERWVALGVGYARSLPPKSR